MTSWRERSSSQTGNEENASAPRAVGLDATQSRITRQPVLRGGPVHTDRGFVLHTPEGQWESSLPFSARVHLTTSRDILDALARGEGPVQAIVALGYAGGQSSGKASVGFSW